MARWILNCKSCEKDFPHSEIKTELFGMPVLGRGWVDKPFFPEGGEKIECPHCHEVALYQRFMLRYREH